MITMTSEERKRAYARERQARYRQRKKEDLQNLGHSSVPYSNHDYNNEPVLTRPSHLNNDTSIPLDPDSIYFYPSNRMETDPSQNVQYTSKSTSNDSNNSHQESLNFHHHQQHQRHQPILSSTSNQVQPGKEQYQNHASSGVGSLYNNQHQMSNYHQKDYRISGTQDSHSQQHSSHNSHSQNSSRNHNPTNPYYPTLKEDRGYNINPSQSIQSHEHSNPNLISQHSSLLHNSQTRNDNHQQASLDHLSSNSNNHSHQTGTHINSLGRSYQPPMHHLNSTHPTSTDPLIHPSHHVQNHSTRIAVSNLIHPRNLSPGKQY
jgi:hypothetical protein